jgi:sec-independent protein translocase protein TatA
VWGLGVGEILIIGLALTLLFGANKIPGIARGLGQGIRNFKGEMGGRTADDDKGPRRLEDGERGKPRRDD